MSRFAHRLTAYVCAFALAAGPVAPALADDAAQAARSAGALNATADTLATYADAVDRTRFDVEALAKSLSDPTPEAIAEWVATNTRLLAYSGSLKGAQGTLEDRAGNSLDRALLLAALLKARGVEVRLARGVLSADAAAAMAQLVSSERPAPLEVDPAAGDAAVERLASDGRVDGARYRSFVEAETTRQAELAARGATMTGTLIAALAPTLAADDAGARTAAVAAALTNHWWVQAEVGGAWADLDPVASIAGAPEVVETIAPDALTAESRHKVTVRVVAEIAREGALGAETLAEMTLNSGDVQGDLIAISHRTGGLAAADDLDGSDAALFASAAGARAWMPMIVHDETAKGKLVTAKGETEEASESNFAKYASLSGLTDAAAQIDALGGDETETGATGAFTAEWIEVEVTTPDGTVTREQRFLFDAIGPEVRASGRFEGELDEAALVARGLALQDEIDLIVMTGAMSKDRAVRRTAALVAEGLRGAAAFIAEDDAAPVAPDGYRRPAAELSEFASTRFAYAPDADAEIVSPNVALLRSGTRARDGAAVESSTFDIVVNAATGTPEAALSAGVADTVSEHLLLGAPEGSHNTAARHASDIASGKSWTTITSADGLDAVTGDAGAKALMAADLARGYTLIAPGGMVLADATWWRIDPKTGVALGMNSAGGAETTEYSVLVAMVFGWGACLYKGKNAKKAAGGNWFRIPKPKRAAIMACFAGVVVGVFMQSATALGLIVGGVGTLTDEF